MRPQIFIALSVLILVTLACTLVQVNVPPEPSDPLDPPVVNTPPSEGDPAQGKLLFEGQVDGDFPCSNCHSLQPDQTLVGPSLAGIGTTAGTRIEGYSAEEYLRESIEQPNAFVVNGFKPDIMPESFGVQMTEGQLADLVAFLITLK